MEEINKTIAKFATYFTLVFILNKNSITDYDKVICMEKLAEIDLMFINYKIKNKGIKIKFNLNHKILNNKFYKYISDYNTIVDEKHKFRPITSNKKIKKNIIIEEIYLDSSQKEKPLVNKYNNAPSIKEKEKEKNNINNKTKFENLHMPTENTNYNYEPMTLHVIQENENSINNNDANKIIILPIMQKKEQSSPFYKKIISTLFCIKNKL
jgi:hypothetical protein